MSDDGNVSSHPTTVIEEASVHCLGLDIEPPLVTSATKQMLSANDDLGELNRRVTLEQLARSCLSEPGIERLRTKPHEESKRREAAERRNRKMIWFGVGAGLAAALAGYLWTGSSGNKDENPRRDRLQWFRHLFIIRRSPLESKTET